MTRLLCWLGLHRGEWSRPFLHQTHGFPFTQHPMDWEILRWRTCFRCGKVEVERAS